MTQPNIVTYNPHRATFTFGLAPRSRQKPKAPIDELDIAFHQVPTFVVDASWHADDVDRVVQEAQVVINAIGPYRCRGSPVVQTCIRATFI